MTAFDLITFIGIACMLAIVVAALLDRRRRHKLWEARQEELERRAWNPTRLLFGCDFPDPAVGQVWRSRHSGRAFRVTDVRRSDCGALWHIGLQHETDAGKFTPIPMEYCMFPAQWRRKLRKEARQLMGGGMIEPSTHWPRHGGPTAPAPLTGVIRPGPAGTDRGFGLVPTAPGPQAITDLPDWFDFGKLQPVSRDGSTSTGRD